SSSPSSIAPRPPTHSSTFPTRRSSDLGFFDPLTARAYTLERGTLRFSVIAVQRRRNDARDAYAVADANGVDLQDWDAIPGPLQVDRKSTRLNSSHVKISYAVFCLKKNK